MYCTEWNLFLGWYRFWKRYQGRREIWGKASQVVDFPDANYYIIQGTTAADIIYLKCNVWEHSTSCLNGYIHNRKEQLLIGRVFAQVLRLGVWLFWRDLSRAKYCYFWRLMSILSRELDCPRLISDRYYVLAANLWFSGSRSYCRTEFISSSIFVGIFIGWSLKLCFSTNLGTEIHEYELQELNCVRSDIYWDLLADQRWERCCLQAWKSCTNYRS